jgi:hypothetical protein
MYMYILRRKLICFISIIFLIGVMVWWFASTSTDVSNSLTIRIEPSESKLAFTSFQLTNCGKSSISYRFMIEKKTGAEWPVYPEGTALPHPGPNMELKRSECTNLVVAVPANCRWRISVVYWESQSIRDKFSAFFRACYLGGIADKLSANKPAYRAYGPEK